MICVPTDHTRRAAALAALIFAATLAGCDLITGVDPSPCELVPLDTSYALGANGDTLYKGVAYSERCGGIPNY